ncbi:MAG: NmrA family NAD(P)-binding protein [Chitinophagaceae bacterium]|nr:NmrA family NAD(P)-binding protein [Rubrivivax sp.]
MRSTILVTGATGRTGGALVQQLRAQDWPVRALVHRIDARSDRLQRLGAEVVVADMHDPDQLSEALRGVQRAYYLPLFQPHMVQAAVAFATAARASRVEAIVQLSQWLSHRAHPSILTRETWLVDHLLAAIPGVAHVVVDPGMFADNFLRVIDFASLLGFYPIFTGDSMSAPVATEDIARVIAALLCNPEPHAGRRYRPTGPKLMSGRDMAAAAARVVGHAVLPVKLPFWMFRKAARLTGASIHEVYSYREYLQDHHNGAFSFDGGVNDVVSQITGQPAEDFETTASRYALMPFARQTAANRLKALARFGVLPWVPGHNLDRYERQMRFPRPPRPSLSSEDPRWLAEHGARAVPNLSTPLGTAAMG